MKQKFRLAHALAVKNIGITGSKHYKSNSDISFMYSSRDDLPHKDMENPRHSLR